MEMRDLLNKEGECWTHKTENSERTVQRPGKGKEGVV